MTDRQWAGTTYGNDWMHRWLVRLLRVVPLGLMYWFVAIVIMPVTFAVNPNRKYIYTFYRRRLGKGRLGAAWMAYRNFCMFAQVVIDKFAIYAGRHFDIEVEGFEHYKRLATRKEGFIQLAAHVGNYEIAGFTLKAKKRINALVYYGEKESVMRSRGVVFDQMNIGMIPIGQGIDYVFEIASALSRGEIVSIVADRALDTSSKTVSVKLFDKDARLPVGPFSIAAAQGLDVLMIMVMKTKRKKYKIYVTPLDFDKSARRAERQEQIALLYSRELERRVREYPLQWYNYFDFWNDFVKP